MRRLAFTLLGLALAACHDRPKARPEPEAAAPADAAAADDAGAPADASDPDAGAPADAGASLALRLVSRKGRDGAVCLVVDASGNTIGHATAHDTAAGGSDVTCDRFDANGKVIMLSNSRGTYSKDARPGPKNDRALPCGDGVYAPDVSTCVQLDASPFAYSPDDPKDSDFDVAMCNVRTDHCTRLVTIPRALNRSFETPRPWDAAYCSNDRVVVVARGALYLFEAPSGTLLTRTPVKGATRVTCHDDIVEIAKPTLRFRIDGQSLSPIPSSP